MANACAISVEERKRARDGAYDFYFDPKEQAPILLTKEEKEAILTKIHTKLQERKTETDPDLVLFADEAVNSYFEQPTQRMGCASVSNISHWCPSLKRVDATYSGDSYGGERFLISSFTAVDGSEIYVLWCYTCGSCSNCDPDLGLEEFVNYASNISLQDRVFYLAHDLFDKVLSGHVFGSLDAAHQFIKQADERAFENLVDGIEERKAISATVKIEPAENGSVSLAIDVVGSFAPKASAASAPSSSCFDFALSLSAPAESSPAPAAGSAGAAAGFAGFAGSAAGSAAEWHPTPSMWIQELIDNDQQATLREVLQNIGRDNVSTDQAKELGTFVKQNLPYRDRKKKLVVRDGKRMSVLVYDPDELARVEALINQYFG